MLRALLANDTSLIGHHGSAVVVRRLVEAAHGAGIELIRGHGWRSLERRTDFGATELVIVNGEGSLHGDTRTARRIGALVERLGSVRPVYVVNTIAEDLAPETLAQLAAARLVAARDAPSAAALRDFGLPTRLVPDATLSAPIAKASGRRLLFTDSVRPEAAAALGAAAATRNAPLLRFDAEPGPDRSDRLGLKRLRRRLRVRFAGAAGAGLVIADTDTFLAFLAAEAGGLVSGRFHGVCLALRIGIPFLAVASNTAKIEALLDEVGMGHRLIAVRDLGRADLAPPPFTVAEEARRRAFLVGVETGWRDLMAFVAADARRVIGAP